MTSFVAPAVCLLCRLVYRICVMCLGMFGVLSAATWMRRNKAECDMRSVEEIARKRKHEEDVKNQVLLSPEILSAILLHLDFIRQKRFRLTCRLWNQEIRRSFSLKSARVRLRFDDDFAKFQSTMEMSVLPPFRDISFSHSEVGMEASDWLLRRFTITELRLGTFPAGYMSSEMTQHTLKMLKGCSQTLRKLAASFLALPQTSDEEMSSKMHFPLLKHLELGPRVFSPTNNPAPTAREYVDFFSSIISASPQLDSLALILCQYSKELLEEILHLDRIQKLEIELIKSLSVHPAPAVWSTLQRLSKSGTLKELRWKSMEGIKPTARVHQVLSGLGSSLERLYIAWILEGVHPPPSLPLLPALTQLELDGLDLDSLNLGNLPSLRVLKFKKILNFSPSASDEFVPGLSVTKVKFRGYPEDDESSSMETFFPKLFLRFPNATTWKVNHKDVPPFCKAAGKAPALIAVRKLGIYLSERNNCNEDEALTYFVDRHKFALLPSLHELEELVLENGTFIRGMEMKLSEIDFPRLPNLKLLKIYNYSDPPLGEVAALECVPRVLMLSSERFYSEPLASKSNVGFKRAPRKYY